jgi:hypothetical protein
MAYTKTAWKERQGTNLNKFNKSAENAASVILTNAPDAVTQAGTPFSVENMNKIEQGIYDAHQAAAANFNTLTSHADMVGGAGRNLLSVLGAGSVLDAMAKLRARCNGTGIPDFTGLMIGDYIDGISLSSIPAHGGGDAGQAWNDGYKNNRIVLSGFNTYKDVGDGAGNAKNHVLFTFRNCILRHRMNPADTNAGGYPASELRAFLEGANGDGTGQYAGDSAVPVAAVMNALKAALGGDYLYTIRKLHSRKRGTGWEDPVWASYTVFLMSEIEVFGYQAFGDELTGPSCYNTNVQFPIFQKSYAYRIKRYNNARQWWSEQTPTAANAAAFARVGSSGSAYYNNASLAIGGVAPAICVA